MAPNLQDELHTLESWVRDLPKNSKGVAGLEKSLSIEVNRIREQWVTVSISCTEESLLHRYVLHHQATLITMLDSVHVHNRAPLLQHACFELLWLLREKFPGNFNQGSGIPETLYEQVAKEYQDFLLILQKFFTETRIDQPLIRLFTTLFAGDARMRFTFWQVEFLNGLRIALSDLMTGKEADDRAVRKLLIAINLNSDECFNYYCAHLAKVFEQCETRPEKIDKISSTIKNISQIYLSAHAGFYPDIPSIKDQLLCYLREEIHHIERTASLPSLPGTVKDSFRIQCELSVSQLAFFVRVMVENKVLLNTNFSELFRFFAQYITTKRADHISADSFRGKFYHIEDGTRESVRLLFSRLVKSIDVVR